MRVCVHEEAVPTMAGHFYGMNFVSHWAIVLCCCWIERYGDSLKSTVAFRMCVMSTFTSVARLFQFNLRKNCHSSLRIAHLDAHKPRRTHTQRCEQNANARWMAHEGGFKKKQQSFSPRTMDRLVYLYLFFSYKFVLESLGQYTQVIQVMFRKWKMIAVAFNCNRSQGFHWWIIYQCFNHFNDIQ